MPGSGNVLIDAIAGIGWLSRSGDRNITYFFDDSFGFHNWTSIEKDAFRGALQEWANVANITIAEVSSSAAADLTERWVSNAYMQSAHGDFGGFHQYPKTSPPALGEYNYDGRPYFGAGALSVVGYGFQLFMHEIGHGLGLAHTHDTDMGTLVLPGVTSSSDLGTLSYNQNLYSIMSYNNGPSMSSGSNNYGHAGSPMAFDIAAIQFLYGANNSYRTGNDTYVLPGVNATGTFWRSIWDAGGTDTISYNAALNVTIDLRAATLVNGDPNAGGFVSKADGIFGGFTIANGVVIENASGGSGNDTLTGNEFSNSISGNDGNDTIAGGAGTNTLDGGAGSDTVDYSNNPAPGHGIAVNLGAGTASNGVNISDTLIGIENIIGTSLDDILIGSSAGNAITAGGGNDTVAGGAGTNTLDGGAGNDTVDYSNNPAPGHGIAVNLGAGTASNGVNISDTLTGIENIIGTSLDDILTGDGANNIFSGGAGTNTLDGGAGSDTVDYSNNPAPGHGIAVDLGAGTASNGVNISDTLIGIENIIGTSLDDILIGSSAGNAITAGGGNDTIAGGAGTNTLDGGAGSDTVSYAVNPAAGHGIAVDLSAGTASNGVNINDALSSIENVIGTSTNDLFTASAAANAFTGNGGDDLFVFNRANANGDTIADFNGNGAAAGDAFRFVGYGTAAAGATFTQVDATHWSINSSDGAVHDIVTLTNGASVHASDLLFV